MSRKSKTTPPNHAADPVHPPKRAKARIGKKAIMGYFSPELSKTLRLISAQEGVTMQALVGEGLDLLLESRGYSAAAER